MDPGHDRKDTKYDLENRTAAFGESVVKTARTIHINAVTRSLVDQLTRAATSIGANYLEASDAESKKDFRHKIALCRKESKETRHWLRMLVAADAIEKQQARTLWQEAKELNLIFGAILRK